jgi:hypothetical protein
LRTTATPIVCGPAGILERPLAARGVPSDQADTRTIECDLDRLVTPDRGETKPGAAARDPELVVGIERKHMLHEETASSPQRKLLAVPGL